MVEKAGAKPPWWLWPNLLSLDAPLVAVLWQGLFALSAGARIPLAAHVLLGLAVWIIYVGDRLIDATRLDVRFPATERHLFYGRHRREFLVVVLFVAAGAAVVAGAVLPEALALRGVFLGLLVAGYFGYLAVIRRGAGVLVPKEVLCGIFFAVGTNLAPAYGVSHASAGGSGVLGFFNEGLLGFAEAARSLPVAAFALLCALNCTVIAVWESGEDEVQDQAALTHWYGLRGLSFSRPLILLAVAGIVLAIVFRGDPQVAVYLCVSASAVGLAVLEKHRGRLSTSARRTLADAALLTPAAALPFLAC